MSIAPPVRFLRFGAFELDLRAGELRRNGVRVRVPDQSIKVLTRLVQNAGEVVTRNELHQELWPNGTIVEFDSGINAVIKRLREALEDSAETPRFIETLPRRGYRFLVPVVTAAAAHNFGDLSRSATLGWNSPDLSVEKRPSNVSRNPANRAVILTSCRRAGR